MITAVSVPICVTAVKAAPGSSQPNSWDRISRCALDEIGRNSVRPWTMPRTMASNQDTTSARPACSSTSTMVRRVAMRSSRSPAYVAIVSVVTPASAKAPSRSRMRSGGPISDVRSMNSNGTAAMAPS